MPDTELPTKSNRRRAIAFTVLAIGVAAIVASLLLPAGRISRAVWTAEKAKRHQAASASVHALSHELAHAPGDADDIRKRLASAQAEYDSLQAQLYRAKHSPLWAASALRWAGLAMTLAGGAAYLSSQQR
jgi:outer membrane murein-binding lipoprotein Lpp